MRIENPITREVLVVARTFAEGHGSAVRFTLPARQEGPPLHGGWPKGATITSHGNST